MKILAVHTSSREGGICFLEDNISISTRKFPTRKNYGQSIFTLIQDELNHLKWDLEDLDLFAVNSGPGSYTGIRVGVTCINGLAFTLGKPSIGVSGLQAIACTQSNEGIICPVISANSRECYSGIYRKEKDSCKELKPEQKLKWEELREKLPPDGRILIIKDDGQDLKMRFKSEMTNLTAEIIGLGGFFLYPKRNPTRPGRILPNYIKEFEPTSPS